MDSLWLLAQPGSCWPGSRIAMLMTQEASPGFLFFIFRTFRAYNSFICPNCELGPPASIWTCSEIRNSKTPSTLQSCSWIFNPFLGFCFLKTTFQLFLPSSCFTSWSMHLKLWTFECISLEPVIFWKRWIFWTFRKLVFSWSDRTDYQLTVGRVYFSRNCFHGKG